MAQEFGHQLLKLGRPGKIINIASLASILAGVNIAAYASTKAGVAQMTKAFSNECGLVKAYRSIQYLLGRICSTPDTSSSYYPY